MRSKIYTGTLVHARSEPVKNAFTYPICMYAIDLDELPLLDKEIFGFGYNRFSGASIYDRDYGGWGDEPIKQKIIKTLAAHGIAKIPHRVMLITTPKIVGFGFNPVSFYYCYDAEDVVFAYVSEINNTFGESTVYVFDAQSNEHQFTQEKNFHVSPFYDNSGSYKVSFKELNETLDISFNLHRPNEKPFIARVTAREASFKQHARVLASFGGTILLTLPRIYYQAVILVGLKRLPVMNKPNPPKAPALLRAEPYSWFTRICAYKIKQVLSRITHGTLVMKFADGREEVFGDPQSNEKAQIDIHSYAMFTKLALHGGIGFGESYVDGDWSSPNLPGLLKLIFNNGYTVEEKAFNWIKPFRFLNLIRLWFQKNSTKKAKQNISDHYDMGNEMFSLFLDPTMTYSSAKFETGNETLEEAQRCKIRSILSKADISEGDTVLEIGCGWGELSTIAARDFGCKVTGITLSEEQAKVCKEKIAKNNVADKVDIQIKDYRHVKGVFDKLVSVEMIEAVGKEYLNKFFEVIEQVLAPDGIAVLQIIAYPECEYKSYLYRQDWIQKHIFPGSHLPSLTAFCESMASHSKLIIENVENLSEHYAKTLAIWRERFNQKSEELLKLGYDDRFQKAWNYYLASCEAQFATRWIALYQIVLTRPNNKKLVKEKELSMLSSLKAA